MILLLTNLAAEWPYSVAEECLGKYHINMIHTLLFHISEIFLLSGMDDESYVYTEVQILFAVSVYVPVRMNETNLLVRIFMK